MDDHDLVLEAREGSKEAFAAIYDRYGDRLYNFLCALMRDRDEAADVLHDSFIVAGARLHQLRDPAKLRPWLYAIARHQGQRRLGQKRRQQPTEEVEVTAPGPDPADIAAQHELTELMAAAAAGLNPRDQIVLELHLREGLEGQELGEAIGVSAGHAYVLLSRLRDQVERSLGALLVARMGRKDCEELAGILTGWDGRFSPVVRKRVARHVDDCDTCSARRRKVVSSLAMLSAIPVAARPPAPAAVRRRVLDDVELVSHQGRSWRGGDEGFPPPLYPPTRRWGVAAVAAAVALLVFAGAAVFSRGGRDTVSMESASGPVTSQLGSTVPSTTTALLPVVPQTGPPAGGGPASSSSDAGSAGLGAPGESSEPGSGAGGVDSGGTTDGDQTGQPADVAGPDLGSATARPATIWTARSGGGACSTSAARPSRATVTVSAGDPSGIATVVLRLAGPVSESLTMRSGGGDTYQVTVGPFDKGAVPRGGSDTIGLEVTATDSAGNPSTSVGSLTLNDCEV